MLPVLVLVLVPALLPLALALPLPEFGTRYRESRSAALRINPCVIEARVIGLAWSPLRCSAAACGPATGSGVSGARCTRAAGVSTLR